MFSCLPVVSPINVPPINSQDDVGSGFPAMLVNATRETLPPNGTQNWVLAETSASTASVLLKKNGGKKKYSRLTDFTLNI